MDRRKILGHARKIVEIECRNLQKVKNHLDAGFVRAVELILACPGKVVVTGIGKSGIVGRKIAGTLASTGTPAIFLHPGEAVHGDLGMVSRGDVVLAISNSGETDEILKIVPFLKRIGAKLVALTASGISALGCQAHAVVSTGTIVEADNFGLVPTSSATCALVLGDALALVLLSLKGFNREDYAVYHPGGSLGRRLLLKVKDVMQTGKSIPRVRVDASFLEAIREINRKNLGFTLVVDRRGKLKGIITDGDLRRLMVRQRDLSGVRISDCLTRNPKTIDGEKLAAQALSLMEALEITCLVILDAGRRPKGIVHLHDLLGKKEFRFEF
jgi:arabinose-5-phosphate isomerase